MQLFIITGGSGVSKTTLINFGTYILFYTIKNKQNLAFKSEILLNNSFNS